MKSLFTILSFLSLLNLPGTTSAEHFGVGYYGTFINNTRHDIKIIGTNHNCWYPNGFESETIIKPGESKVIYSELKNSGSCFLSGGMYQGFRVITGHGTFSGQIGHDRGAVGRRHHCYAQMPERRNSPNRHVKQDFCSRAEGTFRYEIHFSYGPRGELMWNVKEI